MNITREDVNGIINKSKIYLRITGLCNARCGFCIRESHVEKGPSLREIKDTLNKLKEIGFQKISLIGGEVFLRSDLREIIKDAFDCGFQISLPTNGSLISDNDLDYINKYISRCGFPLDGSTREKSLLVRSSFDQFAVTTELLRKLKKLKPNFKVRVTTLATKINKDDIEAVGRLLFESADMYQPDKWSILKFVDLGLGKKNRERYLITNEEFAEIEQSIRGKFPNANLRFSNSTYIFIDAKAQLMLSRDNEIINLGDFKKMSSDDFKALLLKSIRPGELVRE